MCPCSVTGFVCHSTFYNFSYIPTNRLLSLCYVLSTWLTIATSIATVVGATGLQYA